MFQLLDPAPFEACFTRFMQRFAETLQGVVAIDSKTLRRLFDRAAGKSPLHMIHAWSADHRRRLGQLAFVGRSINIKAGTKLLDLLSLKGRIVTADGPHPQDRPSGRERTVHHRLSTAVSAVYSSANSPARSGAWKVCCRRTYKGFPDKLTDRVDKLRER